MSLFAIFLSVFSLKFEFAGTIIAILGQENEGGKFFVDEHCYSEMPYQAQPDIDLALTKGEDRYVTHGKL